MCAQVKLKARCSRYVCYEALVNRIFTTPSKTQIFQAETVCFNTEVQIFKETLTYHTVSLIDINLFIHLAPKS